MFIYKRPYPPQVHIKDRYDIDVGEVLSKTIVTKNENSATDFFFGFSGTLRINLNHGLLPCFISPSPICTSNRHTAAKSIMKLANVYA